MDNLNSLDFSLDGLEIERLVIDNPKEGDIFSTQTRFKTCTCQATDAASCCTTHPV